MKPMVEYLAQDATTLPIAYSRLISLFRNTTQAFPFDGNRVETYTSVLPCCNPCCGNWLKPGNIPY